MGLMMCLDTPRRLYFVGFSPERLVRRMSRVAISQGSHEIVRVVQSETPTNGLCARLVSTEPWSEGETIDLEEMDVEWLGPIGIPS